MTNLTLRSAYTSWPSLNARVRDRVAQLSEKRLATTPGPERWPLWATVGHQACQRVFWLCDFAGAPGAAETPFPNAAWSCPGDDDLEHVLTSKDLIAALDSTFTIIEWCLDSWTPEEVEEEVFHEDWPDSPRQTRAWALQRVFMHDVWHVAELNDALLRAGQDGIEMWG